MYVLRIRWADFPPFKKLLVFHLLYSTFHKTNVNQLSTVVQNIYFYSSHPTRDLLYFPQLYQAGAHSCMCEYGLLATTIIDRSATSKTKPKTKLKKHFPTSRSTQNRLSGRKKVLLLFSTTSCSFAHSHDNVRHTPETSLI